VTCALAGNPGIRTLPALSALSSNNAPLASRTTTEPPGGALISTSAALTGPAAAAVSASVIATASGVCRNCLLLIFLSPLYCCHALSHG